MTRRPNILVTKALPGAGLDLLREFADLTILPDDADNSPPALCQHVRGVDALICFVGEPITAEVLEAAAPTCRIVANYGVGFDSIDITAATRLGIRITNTPDILTNATADLAFAMILTLLRRIEDAAALARSGQWSGVAPMQIFGNDVSGKTLGIIGAGRIGAAVARRGMGFDMPILYCGRKANPDLDRAGARRVDLDTLITESDIISLHVPLTPETRNLIAAPQFARMKPSTWLINTARGAVVNQGDLISAIQQRQIAGAALDVFDNEPEIPAELANAPNVLCLPHIGSATIETRSAMSDVVARNVMAVLDGREPPNPVN